MPPSTHECILAYPSEQGFDMSSQNSCYREECALSQREVTALEHLVGRFQQELTMRVSATCQSCKCGREQALRVTQDELFEHQQLNALEWSQTHSHLTRQNGDRCDFLEVELPSNEWEWTSDWFIDVHSKTDVNGWVYAMSAHDLDEHRRTNSERTVEDRVRRRRWKRERIYVGSKDLPSAVSRQLQHEKTICTMQRANEKLTEQLRRAGEQILEYEDRIKAYELKVLQLQSLQSCGAAQTNMSYTQGPISSAIPFSPSKSREVLDQSEDLLHQIFSAAPLLEEDIRETQRRRSQMVLECHSELDSAVTEFHDLVRTRSNPGSPNR